MSKLPYENATSGDKAVGDMRKILMELGATKFGVMEDTTKQSLIVQFEYDGRLVNVEASVSGYAAAWLRAHPHTSRMRTTKAQHERKALDQAAVSVYSILRDWIKGQVTAIHCGLLSFEGAFLGQIMLPNGVTVLEHVEQQQMLPAP